MNPIPKQLQDVDFRFALLRANTKAGYMDKAWNTKNCYAFFESKLIEHIKGGGNYCVVSGYGDLIMIDFDDKEYMQKVLPLLPPTFTVQTAQSRLYHCYYYFVDKEGDSSIDKIGIDHVAYKGKTWLMEELKEHLGKVKYKRLLDVGLLKPYRVVDIQANKYACVGPGSAIDRKLYTVVQDLPIAKLTLEQLKEVFNLQEVLRAKKKKQEAFDNTWKSVEVNATLRALQKKGIRQSPNHQLYFKCPHHEMHGEGNLKVLPNGSLYCHHCRHWWSSVEHLHEKVIE